MTKQNKKSAKASWRDELDKKFVMRCECAAWVDTEINSKGYSLSDLDDFIEQVEQQAKADARQEVIEEVLQVADGLMDGKRSTAAILQELLTKLKTHKGDSLPGWDQI